MRDVQPAIDAEKIARKQIAENFCPSPCFADITGRSTLLVGTRGSGKTMLLRRMLHDYNEHKGVAVYGDLGRKVLGAISADTGMAGLSFNGLDSTVGCLVQDKTLALIAFWLAEQCKERELEPPYNLLWQVLPEGIRADAPKDARILAWLQDYLYCSDLSLYRNNPNTGAFVDFVCTLANMAQAKSGNPLLLLLDRAEEVPYPCLVPILGLLDQSLPSLAVIACRPGILGPSPDMHPSLPIPGDHYDIKHLGMSPYAEEWRSFQMAVMSSWVPKCVRAMPSGALHLVLNICRDSIRSALDVVYNSTSEEGIYSHQRSVDAVSIHQQMLLTAAQGRLRPLNNDLPSLIRHIRQSSGFAFPVLLQLRTCEQTPLFGSGSSFGESTREEQLVRLGLRAGLFSMPHGEMWHPYTAINAVELHPLFMWRDRDPWRF